MGDKAALAISFNVLRRVIKMRFINLRKFGPKLAVSGLLAVPVISRADAVADITTQVTGSMTSGATLAAAVVGGLFGIWAVFLLLKAKRG